MSDEMILSPLALNFPSRRLDIQRIASVPAVLDPLVKDWVLAEYETLKLSWMDR